MKISIVIPVYNERDTISKVIDRVLTAPTEVHEVIVVDDGSTDGTADVLRDGAWDERVKVHIKPQNGGKGSAVRLGFGQVTGDLVLIQDADMEYNPQDYPRLVRPIIEDKADVVYGSRFIGDKDDRAVPYFWHTLGNQAVTKASNLFTGLMLSDMETCYKAFRAEYLGKMRLTENDFRIEPELTAELSKLKLRFHEVAITYQARNWEQGKKIRFSDGIKALICIFKNGLLRK